jgi:hypothetical protein
MTCPKASVLTSALGQPESGPVVSGTPQSRICTYTGAGGVHTTLTISSATPATFQAAEQAAANQGVTVVTVRGLGDQAWAAQGGGSLTWLRNNAQVQISSPGTATAQLEDLAIVIS